MAFEVSDNVVFRHDWWESIAERDRQLIVGRTMSGADSQDRKPDSLMNDGLKALSCSVFREHSHYGIKDGG
jgi:hypothetical protein